MTLTGIHAARRILPLGLTLRTTLGIPRSSVGSQAVGIGPHWLAGALAARRQRLTVGTEARLLGRTRGVVTRVLSTRGTFGACGEVRIEIRIAALTGTTRTARTATAAVTTLAAGTATAAATAERTIAARSTGTTIAAGTTRTTTACEAIAATATLAARTTGTAIATGTATWTTAATRTATARTATTATTAAIPEIARRSRQLPADARTRHLAATGTIIFLLLFFRRADLEAAKATRLVAVAATTEAAATATTTTTATRTATTTTLAALTAATATATAALVAIATATACRSCDAIDHVVELAARDRVVRTLLALEHAHEAHLIDAIADDVERLDETRGAIGLDVERCSDGCDRSFVLLRRCGRWLPAGGLTARSGGRITTLGALGAFGARCLCVSARSLRALRAHRVVRALRAVRALERRRGCARVGGFAAGGVSRFDVIRGGDWRRALRRCTCCGCVTQQ